MSKKETKEKIVQQSIREGYNLPGAYFEVQVNRAASKAGIIPVLGLEQLTGNRLEKFYVDTDRVRDANTIQALVKILDNPLSPYNKLLFSGFTGSGKTTELIKLYYEMQPKLNVIIFSAWNRLTINEITIETLLFEILEDLLNYLYTNEIFAEDDKVLDDIIEQITEWCFDTRITLEKKKEKSKSRGAGIQFLKGIFFDAKTGSSSTHTGKIESIRIEERKIKNLIFECNRLFDYLKAKTGKQTLIIIDDLEKMRFLTARTFFTGDSAFIRDFRCKVVLTIPVELIYHPDFAIIKNVFGEAEVLPMIKLKTMDGQVHEPGIQCLVDILERRLDLSIFEGQCYMDAVTYSGGAIRELFSIIRRAAIIEESEKITAASITKSIDYHKSSFSSMIQERDDEIKIKFDEYLQILFDIYDGNKTAPAKTLALLDLLRTRAVLRFNGKGFYDTHPLLEDFILDYKKQFLKNGKPQRGE